jgi:tRNA pseudouridine-54 N-methylase
MGDIPYWTSSKVTIKDKDEERTEKVLKVIKEQGDDIKSSDNNNAAYIIGSIRLKHESVMNVLKLIFAVLTISTVINTFLLLVLCYSLGVFG